jgi:hypothetical protein
MRTLSIAVLGLLAISPALASSVPVEKVVTYYEDGNHRNVVGEATFYCDNTIVTTGMVTADAVEVYYGCP